MIATFVRFGPAHLAAIALTLVIPMMLAAIARLDGSGATARAMNLFLAAMLVANKAAGLALLSRDNELTIESLLPMHLCDWAAITVVITLIYPNQ
jgi:uncharacterized membrane protein YwaF